VMADRGIQGGASGQADVVAVERAPSSESISDAFRDLLVPQDESDASLGALLYADGLCAAFGAHLSGLMFGLVPYYPMSLTTAAAPEGWMQAQRQASDEATLTELRLKAVYRKLVATSELKRVDAFEQEVGRICARRARSADLTVIGWSPDGGCDLEHALFETCLFDSGRPVLLVPAGHAFRGVPQRALVAWNGSREAARALREAMPLLRRIRLTRLVAVDAADCDGDGDDPCAGVARHLARHHIRIEIKRANSGGRDIATILTEEAAQFGAGIVVLGGYGHIRAGQWVYGGTTRAALAHAKTPLFFAN
jgi:nucleotide-binding universal stress UspA family protein